MERGVDVVCILRYVCVVVKIAVEWRLTARFGHAATCGNSVYRYLFGLGVPFLRVFLFGLCDGSGTFVTMGGELLDLRANVTGKGEKPTRSTGFSKLMALMRPTQRRDCVVCTTLNCYIYVYFDCL